MFFSATQCINLDKRGLAFGVVGIFGVLQINENTFIELYFLQVTANI